MCLKGIRMELGMLILKSLEDVEVVLFMLYVSWLCLHTYQAHMKLIISVMHMSVLILINLRNCNDLQKSRCQHQSNIILSHLDLHLTFAKCIAL